jgi:hypothetical protein
MLLKMYKYDMRNVSLPLIIVHAAVLLLGILSGIFLPMNQILNSRSGVVTMIGSILAFIFALSFLAAEIMTHLILIIRFYRRMFTNEGYLTNALPLTADQKILSHTLAYFTWSVIDAAVVSAVFAFWLAMAGDFGNFFTGLNQISEETHMPVALGIFLLILMMCLSFLMMSSLCHISTSIGSLSAAHKGLLSFAMYIVFSWVFQIAAFVFLMLAAAGSSFSMLRQTDARPGSLAYTLSGILPYIFFVLAGMAAVTILFYFISRYIIGKHLNLS